MSEISQKTTSFNAGSPVETLQKYWGYSQFRPLQEDIVTSLLQGKDTLALLPTGGGKSICYQVPAMMQDGVCIVISPLISLMEDQVNALRKRDIKALAIHSFMTPQAIDGALDSAVYGDIKLLYVSPERVRTELFIERFKKMRVSFIAVDESHCISQWGHEFRPAYLEISQLREVKPELSILALTATATEKVIEDISGFLGMKDPAFFRQSFRRDNISFQVQKIENKAAELFRIIKQHSGTGIIYVRSRKRCKEIAELLHQEGLQADYYHAGLSHEIRSERQLRWTKNKNAIMVATNAFGMGIDKSDVRYVVHWDLPDSPEAFYQEAGRAGRDGLPSVSVVMYAPADIRKSWQHYYAAYPAVEIVQKIYQHLCNFLQVPRQSLPEKAFEFDLAAFGLRADMGKSACWNALKILEQEGFLTLSEGLYQPSTIQILANKRDLMTFETQNPSLAEIIQYLLRAHSGIMDHPIQVDLYEGSRKLGSQKGKLATQLQYMDKLNLLRFNPANSAPMVAFARHVVAPSEIRFSTGFKSRKDAHFQRTKTMVHYVENKDKCRNQIILEYFNEIVNVPCGNCDVCRSNQASGLSAQELKKSIIKIIKEKGAISEKELIRIFPSNDPNILLSICRELLEDETVILTRNLEFKIA